MSFVFAAAVLLVAVSPTFCVTPANVLKNVRCFDKLGCYDRIKFFHRTFRPVSIIPNNRVYINTTFMLHTRSTDPFITFAINDTLSLQDGQFDAQRKTIFIVHGFMETGSFLWIRAMALALLKKEDVNVIVVDWTGGNGNPYSQAVANAWVVGGEIYLLVEFLKKTTNLKPSQVHVIGHSLGAHVAGYAGNRMEQTIGRITGLDPANPDFQFMPAFARLDPTDAVFVDVIHTNGINKAFSSFGLQQPLGHLDFYPNGGVNQPGCVVALQEHHYPFSPYFDVLNYAGTFMQKGWNICSHIISRDYFIASVRENCSFMAFECDSYQDFLDEKCISCGTDGSKCARMGYYAHKTDDRVNRLFYLQTTSSLPYCKD